MIETANLNLIPCELTHFEATFRGHDELERVLNVSLADEWFGFEESLKAMPFMYERLKFDPSAREWWMYLVVHKAHRMLIGTGGFKGEADDAGTVEFGYAIAPDYRRRGLATEAARGFVEFAFAHPHINAVQAHTLLDGMASINVLKKVGLKLVGEFHDAEDGDVLRWFLTRAEYQNLRA
ncbi:MAG: hypothetical protein NVSMB56_13080 [Pyrinomonadaceae bacterium]